MTRTTELEYSINKKYCCPYVCNLGLTNFLLKQKFNFDKTILLSIIIFAVTPVNLLSPELQLSTAAFV
ncbi:MAG: hypothetical protein ACRDE8_01525 [Ginsengibacter sp.]